MGVRTLSRWVLLSLTFAVPALADPALPAVWYRASETCPNGAQFLDKLAESSRAARLAQGGDHVDFVVTLIADGKGTVGRLERQTDSGIVAIRELRDATCDQVADALALSLGLALTPGHSNAEPALTIPGDAAGTPATTASTVPSEAAAPAAPSSTATSPSGVTATAAPAAIPPAPAAARPEPAPAWSIGGDLSAMIGITTHPLPRGEL
ncbi:MAG TPA: hypothetical protein VFK05_21780, partial [Polyangiaceae bacterium]|nr:hypothetical protein [Polyangiaceae bacterium]